MRNTTTMRICKPFMNNKGDPIFFFLKVSSPMVHDCTRFSSLFHIECRIIIHFVRVSCFFSFLSQRVFYAFLTLPHRVFCFSKGKTLPFSHFFNLCKYQVRQCTLHAMEKKVRNTSPYRLNEEKLKAETNAAMSHS